MRKALITSVMLTCLLLVSSVKGQEKERVEKDLLGEKKIPAEAYYGVQTARALENFQISGVLINHYPGFVQAWAIVKLAAARANADVGVMNKETLAAIEKACQAVLDGKYHDQFLVDWYQGGAGTSTNMNANEVLANIALELTGHRKGEYQFVEPSNLVPKARYDWYLAHEFASGIAGAGGNLESQGPVRSLREALLSSDRSFPPGGPTSSPSLGESFR